MTSAPRLPTPGIATLDLLVIVVNFRTPALTLECLRSLAAEGDSRPGIGVVVVDNGSDDESVRVLAEAIEEQQWGAWLSLVVSPANLGFAGGCNLGLAAGPPSRHVLLLNSDARVHPGSLLACLETMDRDATIGALSCLVLESDGSPQNVTRRFPTPGRLIAGALGFATRWPRFFGWADLEDPGWDRRTTAKDVDWIGGAFLMLRGDLLRRLGSLDEDFFFMGEDVELCHRIRGAGYRCHYDPSVAVTHIGAASGGPTPRVDEWRQHQLYRARYLYLRKCHGQLAAASVRCVDLAAWGLRALWRVLAYPAGHANRVEAAATWRLLSQRLDSRA